MPDMLGTVRNFAGINSLKPVREGVVSARCIPGLFTGLYTAPHGQEENYQLLGAILHF